MALNKKQKKWIYNIFILVLIVIGIFYVCSRFIHFGNVEFTDDAQVRQQIIPVNSRVQGFIEKIYFTEFQRVHKGDTLVVIEDSEYKLRLAEAKAAYATASAGKTVTSTTVNTAANNIFVSDAGIEEAKAQMENAQKELERYKNLLQQKAVTQQQYDNVETTYRSMKARYEQVSRQKATSSLVHTEQTKRLSQSEAALDVAQTQVELAELNLSYTVITAPCDGYVSRKEVIEGQLIQPGQTVVNVVSDEDVWVVANFRETQLKHITEGAATDIEVDAVNGVVYKGRVAILSKATQASYSLIPSSNSAGNFVKVEQRVPVRILFTDENSKEDMARLRSGLNVECTVRY